MEWLWRLDLNAFRAINVGCHRDFLDPFFLAITYTGLGQVQVVATLIFLRWRATRTYVLPVLAVWLLSGVLNNVVKRLIERDRPSNLVWSLPQEAHRFNSFPSGHAVTSFAIAFLLLIAFWRSDKAWTGWVGLVWATLVGFSRVYRGVHWPTDVLGAAGLGMACAALVAMAMLPRCAAQASK